VIDPEVAQQPELFLDPLGIVVWQNFAWERTAPCRSACDRFASVRLAWARLA
jgi:hypothetical protein